MSIFAIHYHLNYDSTEFFDKIEDLTGIYHYVPNTNLVLIKDDTNYFTPQVIYDRLFDTITNEDFIFIVDTKNSYGYLPDETLDFLSY